MLLSEGDPSSLVAAAGLVTEALGGRTGGEYARWLSDTVGGLEAKNEAVIKAVTSLGVPVATTNYDGLIEQVLGWERVTWMDGAGMQRPLQGDDAAVVHLHGHWRDPRSVILGVRSYEELRTSGVPQALQQAIAALGSLLFVGVGAGLSDPNFGALRVWLAATFSGSEFRHYRLCLASEVDELVAEHGDAERILPVPYGDSYEQLGEFLQELGGPRLGTAPHAIGPAEAWATGGAAALTDRPTRLETWLRQRLEVYRRLARERHVQGDDWYLEKMGEWELDTVRQMALDADPVAPGLVDEYRRDPQTGHVDGVVPPHGVQEYDQYYERRLDWLTHTLSALVTGGLAPGEGIQRQDVSEAPIGPEHLGHLRALLRAIMSAIAGEQAVFSLGPLSSEFERGMFSAHSAPLVRDVKAWDEAVGERRGAPQRLRSRC